MSILVKTPQQGPSQDFWPDQKSLPRNYGCLSPLKSQSRPGASRCTTALAVGGKQGSKAEEKVSGSSSASIGRCVPQTSGKATLPPAEEYLYLYSYTHSHSHRRPAIHRPASDPCRACLCGAAASSSSFHCHRLAPWPTRICPWRGCHLCVLSSAKYRLMRWSVQSTV